MNIPLLDYLFLVHFLFKTHIMWYRKVDDNMRKIFSGVISFYIMICLIGAIWITIKTDLGFIESYACMLMLPFVCIFMKK